MYGVMVFPRQEMETRTIVYFVRTANNAHGIILLLVTLDKCIMAVKEWRDGFYQTPAVGLPAADFTNI